MRTLSGRGAALLATAGAALAVAGCSSSAHGMTVDKAFVAKANAICAAAVAQHTGAKLPVANFDPLHPQAEDLPAIGRYFATYGGAVSTATQLDGLAAPSKGAAQWTRLRELVDLTAANAQQQITLAERSDVAGFERTVHRARSLSEQIDKVGPQLGFASSSPCHEVFG